MLSGYFVAFGPNFSQKLGNAGASPNYFLSSSYGRRALFVAAGSAKRGHLAASRQAISTIRLFNNNTASKNLCKSFLEEQDVTEAQVHGVTSSR
ncbi:hypothetical protein [Microcoleus sp.]|uniref:hypothetical protein n=1 Tax=Microcoleus sp. TaxID=44472 RepID=UPI00359466BD